MTFGRGRIQIFRGPFIHLHTHTRARVHNNVHSKTNATDSYCGACVCVCLFTMGVKSYKYYVG